MSRTLELSLLLSSEDISHTRLADNTGVILDVDSLQVFSLNETGLFLVDALREGISDHEGLVRRLVTEFDIDEAVASRDIDTFVEELGRQLARGDSRS